MIPLLLTKLPWRFIGIALAVLLAVGAIYAKGRSDGADRVQTKFDAYKNTAQVEYDRQVAKTTRIQDAWNRSKERESEINARLQVVTLESVSLFRSLRDYRARVRALSEAAGTPAESDAAGRVAGQLEQAEADHLAACSRDSERLTQWQAFYSSLRDAS